MSRFKKQRTLHDFEIARVDINSFVDYKTKETNKGSYCDKVWSNSDQFSSAVIVRSHQDSANSLTPCSNHKIFGHQL